MSSYGNVPNDTRVKIGHLVSGLVFVGLAGSWALREGGVIGDVGVGWLLPAILVGAGVIGLLAMVAGTLRRNRPQPVAAPVEPEGVTEPQPEAAPEVTTETTEDTDQSDDTLVIDKEENR